MAKFTITAARIEGGNAARSHSRKVATVRADTGTEYEIHLPCGRFAAEVATLAKTPHGRAWRWAKDLTRGTVAAVLEFVTAQNIADLINWAGDVRDMRAEFTVNEHATSPAMAVMCCIKSVGSAHPVNGFGPDRRAACIKALQRAGMPAEMAAQSVDSVRGYTPEAAAVPVRQDTAPMATAQTEVTMLRALLGGLKTRTLARRAMMDEPENDNPRVPDGQDYERLYSDVLGTLIAGDAIPSPKRGRIWGIFDDDAELCRELPMWLHKGAALVSLDTGDMPRIGYVLEMVKADAPHILEYTPEAEEWLID